MKKKDSSLRNSTRLEDYAEMQHDLISPSKLHVAIGERKNSLKNQVP
jgi:hypothetical protein